MEVPKVLVKEGDIAIMTCPSCKKMKRFSVAQFKKTGKRQLLIKCNCGALIKCCLEFRQYPRKMVNFLGRSTNLSRHRECQDIIVRNLSLGGIGFCPGKRDRIRKDDRLLISFALKDSKNTFMKSEVVVRNASPDYIGCAFQASEDFRPELGFFLLG